MERVSSAGEATGRQQVQVALSAAIRGQPSRKMPLIIANDSFNSFAIIVAPFVFSKILSYFILNQLLLENE